jgi:hypothetical protein
MPSLGVAAVAKKHPLLYFAVCVLVVGFCVALRTSSFFQLGSRTSTTLVAHLHDAFLLGVVPPMSAIMDSLQGFHRFGHFWCLVSYIPNSKFLIEKLHFKQWPLLDLLYLGVFQARRGALGS